MPTRPSAMVNPMSRYISFTMSKGRRLKCLRVYQSPSSIMTTSRPSAASSAATTAPPAPDPTTATSQRTSSRSASGLR